MGHRQEMTPEQRLKFDTENYLKRLESKKGSNYQYWTSKHDKMLSNGWDLALITIKSKRNENNVFSSYSTIYEDEAKKILEDLRKDNCFARIVCGYDRNKQRIKMFSVIYKKKQLTSNP